MILHIMYVQIKSKKKKRKKKDWPTDPPNFRAKRTNKPYIFLGLNPNTGWDDVQEGVKNIIC